MFINIFMKKEFGLIIALLIAFSIITAFSLSVVYAESEPNDSIATADQISVGLSNAEIDSMLEPEGDVDYYRFDAVAGRTYVIETFNIEDGSLPGTEIRLFDEEENQIAYAGINGTGYANARLVYTFSEGGTYYIEVSDHGLTSGIWTGTYSLRILPKYNEPGAMWDSADDNEPNDVWELANQIDIGLDNSQTHQLFDNSNYLTGLPYDLDYYHFDAVAGRTYVIEIFNVLDGGSSGTELRLYDEEENQLAYGGTNGTGNASSRIVHTFIEGGTYYIEVSDHGITSGVWTGTYSLRILPKYDEPGAMWDSANDNEPNDVWELANQIDIGLDNSQTHQLFDNSDFLTGLPYDLDYYHFDAVAGRTYVIEIFNVLDGGSSGTELRLYDEEENQLAYGGTNGTGNASSRIVHTFTEGGTYYIEVSDHGITSGVWTGTYSLRILPKYDEPGAVWDSANDNEPNDVWELANNIQMGANNSLTHELFDNSMYLSGPQDIDYFWFSGEAGHTYVIELFNIQGNNISGAEIRLYDETNQLASDGNMSGEIEAKIEYSFIQGGTYYIEVSDHGLTSGIWKGTYSLRICEDSCLQYIYLPMIIR